MSIPFDGTSNSIPLPPDRKPGEQINPSGWIHPPETWESLMRKPCRFWDYALSTEEIMKIYNDGRGSLASEGEQK